jgi:TetR/AcrR family transcriptional regulator
LNCFKQAFKISVYLCDRTIKQMGNSISPEEKIKEAAKRVFIAKGFSGCTSREIAKEAGVNVALVNYYFRSKNQLFTIIYNAVMKDFLLSMIEVFSSNLPLKEKVGQLIEREYEFLSKHPEIPSFVINETARNKNTGIESQLIIQELANTGIFHETFQAQENGEMRKTDIVSIIMLIMANCQHPFMAKPLIQKMQGISDDEYKLKLSSHKEVVKEMIVSYLFPN